MRIMPAPMLFALVSIACSCSGPRGAGRVQTAAPIVAFYDQNQTGLADSIYGALRDRGLQGIGGANAGTVWVTVYPSESASEARQILFELSKKTGRIVHVINSDRTPFTPVIPSAN
jgi:hypothetical protein